MMAQPRQIAPDGRRADVQAIVLVAKAEGSEIALNPTGLIQHGRRVNFQNLPY